MDFRSVYSVCWTSVFRTGYLNYSWHKEGTRKMKVFSYLVFLMAIKKGNPDKLMSKGTMNWIEAQRFCQDKGTISRKTKLDLEESTTAIKTGIYWTRVYTKRSRLIHLYGCFHEEAVKNLTILNQTTKEKISPGKCQDICLDKTAGYDTFAIQEKTCACLSEPPAFTAQRLPDVTKKGFCDYKQTFNVYRTDDGDFYQSKSEHRISKNDEDICVQLLCDKHNTTRFSRVSCKSMGHALCTNRVIKGDFTWEAAIIKCMEESTNTSAEILKADIDLSSNPWNVCTSNNISVNQPVWLGIRTIQYDAEYENEEESDKEEAIRCQSCKKECKFENCSEFRLVACETKLLKRVTDNTNVPVSTNYQSKMSNVQTKPQSTPKTTPTHKKTSLTPSTDSRYRSTTEESNSQRTDPQYTSIATEITESNAFKDLFGNKYTTIIYIISAVLVAIVICSSCIYFRKKRQGKETMGWNADPSNTCHANLVAKTDIYELADNSKMIPLYSVAESINTDKADVGRRILEQKDGVETTEIKLTVRDDIYNYLREVVASDHQSENIYDHSTQRDGDKDESLYDVTKKETNIQVIPDPTYGHISP